MGQIVAGNVENQLSLHRLLLYSSIATSPTSKCFRMPCSASMAVSQPTRSSSSSVSSTISVWGAICLNFLFGIFFDAFYGHDILFGHNASFPSINSTSSSRERALFHFNASWWGAFFFCLRSTLTLTGFTSIVSASLAASAFFIIRMVIWF